ncbi:hypothetical protein TCAL_01728 [Tigriopus californicus]|uniref:G-protein coupled receptors family 1 profile domain-containing protein n=1 Tax=Tigriopus californicus TaxID=6832 RepID=A0A553PML7_TIGCA|nr:muscarinic acetylcholine receptor DM1-like [Tigriopus californicus]TRY78937.1 hypothetical protein TCAL_01728 [Tigriopus californicus]
MASSNASALYNSNQVVLIGASATLLSVATILGNLLVLVSFKMDKRLQTISNYFLCSLAVADIIIGSISMPLFTVNVIQNEWPFGAVPCDIWLSVDYLASNASVLNLLVISFDRYFSVTRPLTYRASRTTRRAALMIIWAWGLSAILWPPWIVAWPYIEGERTVPQNDCYVQFIYSNKFMSILTMMVAFFIPVCVMIGLYLRIWWITVKRQKNLFLLQGGRLRQSIRFSRQKPAVWSARLRHSRFCSSSTCCFGHRSSLEGNLFPNHRGQVQEPIFNIATLENRSKEESSDMLSSFRCSNPKVENVATKVTIQENKVFPPVHRLSGAEVDKTHPSMGLSKDERENEETRPSKTPNDPLRASLPCDLEQRPSSNYVDSDMTEEDDHGSTFTILIRFPAWGYPQSKCPTIQMIGSPAEIKPGTDFDSIWTKLGTSSERLNASRLDLSMGNSCDSNSRSPSRPSSEQHRARPSPLGVVHPSNKRQDKKAAKTLSAILLAFIVTWTPYSVFVIANALLGKAMADHFIPKILWQFAYALCYINSTVNPILYALCNPNFRQTYIRILSGRWCADS